MRAVPTGCMFLDRLLGGGLPVNDITLIYGEAETGKSTLAMQCAVGSARMGYKTLLVDSDGTFSPKRLSQMADYDFGEVSPLIVLVRPANFQEQAFTLDHLEEYVTSRVGLVVVDTITSLYRAEFGTRKETFALNRELNRQMASLTQITKTHGVATLITSQVRSILDEGQMGVEPVATRVLTHWSDIVIHLEPTAQGSVIRAILKKHPRRRRALSFNLKIDEKGIHEHGR